MAESGTFVGLNNIVLLTFHRGYKKIKPDYRNLQGHRSTNGGVVEGLAQLRCDIVNGSARVQIGSSADLQVLSFRQNILKLKTLGSNTTQCFIIYWNLTLASRGGFPAAADLFQKLLELCAAPSPEISAGLRTAAATTSMLITTIRRSMPSTNCSRSTVSA